jgi:hypothetical protein
MTQMNAKAIVTIYFRDGNFEQRPHWSGLHVEKHGSAVLLTIDGRTHSYANVSSIEVFVARTEDSETEMVA